MKGTLDVAAPALTVRGVGPWQVSGHGRIEGARLVLDPLTAEGYGGRLVAEGSVALAATAKTDARVRAEGIDVAALARAFSEAEVPVAARADASLHWATTGWDVDAARGTGADRPPPGRARRAPAPRGSPSPARAGSSSRAGRSPSRAPTSRRTAPGSRRTRGSRRTAGSAARGGPGSPSPRPARSRPTWARRRGSPRGSRATSSPRRARRHGRGPARDVSPAPERGPPGPRPGPTLEGEARYAGGRLSLAPLTARSGEGILTLTGSLPARADAGDWDLQGDAQSFDLAPVLAMAGIEGRGEATGTLRVGGPRDAPRGRAELSARLSLPAGAGQDGRGHGRALGRGRGRGG